ncbi:MAG: hypothetical protein OXE97_00385, partial [Gammaproteobacteria bacterium]|nr:hypothetical protein [Gammaproteobacteria bacterium]
DTHNGFSDFTGPRAGASPLSWKGVLEQYVGRLHRSHPEKREALVYDYVDSAVPVLKRMGDKRVRGYRNIGYFVENAP